MKKLRSILLKYGITTAIGALMVWITLSNYGFSEMTSAADRYRLLCDAFTIPGVILMMIAILVWLSRQGALDGVGYAFTHAVKMLIPGQKKHEKYGDYVARKHAKDEEAKGKHWFIFFVGLAFFLVALVFFALFYSVY